MSLIVCACGRRVYVAKKARSPESIKLDPVPKVFRVIETTIPKGLRAEPMPQHLEGHVAMYVVEHRCEGGKP